MRPFRIRQQTKPNLSNQPIAADHALAPADRGNIEHRPLANLVKSMFGFPAALLWIPSLANGYIAGLIAQLAWENAHGGYGAQADFSIAMRIAAISLPIACLMVAGLCIWATMHFAARRSIGAAVSVGQLTVVGLNILAPAVLWIGLMRIVR